jgi:hypothetical protein
VQPVRVIFHGQSSRLLQLPVLTCSGFLEKPESGAADGLCPVRSSKAKRLQRIKPGNYHPPSKRPVYVPGFRWLSVLLLRPSGPSTVAAMQWWTTRSGRPSSGAPPPTAERTVQSDLLFRCVQSWGQGVLHLFDRRYAGAPWLGIVLEQRIRFVIRWPERYHLVDDRGRERSAWQMSRSQRSWEARYVQHTRRADWRMVGVLAVPVTHRDSPTPVAGGGPLREGARAVVSVDE